MDKYYRVRSQEEFNWLMKNLEDEGWTWIGGEKPTEFLDTWGIYGDEMVVYEKERALIHSGLKHFEEEYENFLNLTEVSELMKESSSENTDLNPIKPAH